MKNKYEELVKNAPILEWDDDSAERAKNYFFKSGKKPFEQFDIVKQLGITKALIFFPRAFDKLTKIKRKCKLIYEFKSASSSSPVYLYDNRLVIALCPLGGPGAANLMEELDYVGIKTFVSCGTCGCINKDVNLEHYFIPTSAIRDEGLSYHYLPASRTVQTSEKVNNAIRQALKEFGKEHIEGVVWTCDAMYRETPERTKRRNQEGAIGVDMECASLSACAKFNKVEFGELLYFSDKTDGKNWQWRMYDKINLRYELVQICIRALELL